ncbi:MAG: glycosyltransferase family 2 protein [Lachnospiraceae bacterium]
MEKKLSFVIPCYRSQKTVGSVIEEIREMIKKEAKYDYEIILVNDGSPDDVWDVIKEYATQDKHILGVNLARNFGQHSAVLAGYHYCTGDYVISLDDDGQTPAGEVPELIHELETGYDVVYAKYNEMHQKAFRRWGSDFARRMSDYIFGVRGYYTGSFFVARRFVIDEMIRYQNCYPYLGGLVLRTTRNIGYVSIEHNDRLSGQSGYSLKKLISLWFNGFTAFSVKPLEISTYIGFLFAFIGFVYTIVIIVRRLFIPELEAIIPYGWSSQTAIMLVIGGLILINMGLMGEYIGRIYICINNSPQFVVREVCGSTEKEV